MLRIVISLSSSRSVLTWAMLAYALIPSLCFARPFDQTPVTVEFKQDGTVEARVAFDVNAMLADVPFRDLADADYERIRNMTPTDRAERLESIADYLRIRVRLKFDGKAIDTKIVFPEIEKKSEDGGTGLPGDYFVARGVVPVDAESFTFTASPMFFQVFLLIRVEGEKNGIRHVLPPGAETEPFREIPVVDSTKELAPTEQGATSG